jgi:hypothetical protein
MIRRRGLQQVIRNSILVATLIGHMLSLFGLPAFITRVGWHKDLRVPFPCMYRPCGCKNAEDCWHNCCCLSLAERIAWAKQYNPSLTQGLSPVLDSQSCGSNTLAEPCCEANSCAQDNEHRCPECCREDFRHDHVCNNEKTESFASKDCKWVHPQLRKRCQGKGDELTSPILSLPANGPAKLAALNLDEHPYVCSELLLKPQCDLCPAAPPPRV